MAGMDHVLASNTIGPVVLVLFLAPIAVGGIFLIYLTIKRGTAADEPRRSRGGLVLALVPLIFGALLLFFFLTVRGGAPRFFYIVAAFPLLVGIKLLQVWSRPSGR
jgi:hypothetical protein